MPGKTYACNPAQGPERLDGNGGLWPVRVIRFSRRFRGMSDSWQLAIPSRASRMTFPPTCPVIRQSYPDIFDRLSVVRSSREGGGARPDSAARNNNLFEL